MNNRSTSPFNGNNNDPDETSALANEQIYRLVANQLADVLNAYLPTALDLAREVVFDRRHEASSRARLLATRLLDAQLTKRMESLATLLELHRLVRRDMNRH